MPNPLTPPGHEPERPVTPDGRAREWLKTQGWSNQHLSKNGWKNRIKLAELLAAYHAHRSAADRQALVRPLKAVCDRTWDNETPEQIVAIAANAVHWRDVEIEKLRGLLRECGLHIAELREAWQRGALSEHDGKGGTRSNRNADLASKIRRALSGEERDGHADGEDHRV